MAYFKRAEFWQQGRHPPPSLANCGTAETGGIFRAVGAGFCRDRCHQRATKEKGRRNGYESVVDLRNQIALASEGDYAVLADHGIFSIDGTNRLAQN